MNATADVITPTTLADRFTAAYGRRIAALAAVDKAVANAISGRETAEVRKAEHVKRLNDRTAWKDRHSRRYREWIESGQAGPEPLVAIDAAAEAKLATAEANHEAAVAAVGALQAAEVKARSELSVADAVVARLVGEQREVDKAAALTEASQLLLDFQVAFARALAVDDRVGDELNDRDLQRMRLRATFEVSLYGRDGIRNVNAPRTGFYSDPVMVAARQVRAERDAALLGGADQ